MAEYLPLTASRVGGIFVWGTVDVRDATKGNGNNPGTGISMVLQDRHKIFICQCSAEFKSPQETVASFLQEFKDDIEKAGIWDDVEFTKWLHGRVHYYRDHPNAAKWQALAKELRERWLAGVTDLILVHKRPRIEELQKHYFKIPDEGPWKTLDLVEEVEDPETGEPITRTRQVVVSRMNTAAKVQALEQIRKEVEGDKTRLEVSGPDGKPLTMALIREEDYDAL